MKLPTLTLLVLIFIFSSCEKPPVTNPPMENGNPASQMEITYGSHPLLLTRNIKK